MELVLDTDDFKAWLEGRGLAEGSIDEYAARVSQSPLERIRARSLSPKYRRLIRDAWRSYARFLAKSDPEASAALLAELDDIRLPPAVRQKAQVPLPRPVFDALRAALAKDSGMPLAVRGHIGVMTCRGFRSGDVLRLRQGEITSALKNGVLAFQGKGAKRLEFGVLKTYRPHLESLREAFDDPRRRGTEQTVCDLIAKTEVGAKMTVRRALHQIAGKLPLKKHGLEVADVRPHVLRRTYATLFYEACGRDPVKLQSHMGWAHVTTALGYVDHVKREELDEVAESMF